MEGEDDAAAAELAGAASIRQEIESSYISVLSELRRINAFEQQLGALGECSSSQDEEVQVRVARDAFERAVSGFLSSRSRAAQARGRVNGEPERRFEPGDSFADNEPVDGGVWQVRYYSKASNVQIAVELFTYWHRMHRNLRPGNLQSEFWRTKISKLRRSPPSMTPGGLILPLRS